MRLSVVRYAVIRCPSASIDSRGEHDIASPFATASYVAQILGHFTAIKLRLIEGDRPNAVCLLLLLLLLLLFQAGGTKSHPDTLVMNLSLTFITILS